MTLVVLCGIWWLAMRSRPQVACVGLVLAAATATAMCGRWILFGYLVVLLVAVMKVECRSAQRRRETRTHV